MLVCGILGSVPFSNIMLTPISTAGLCVLIKKNNKKILKILKKLFYAKFTNIIIKLYKIKNSYLILTEKIFLFQLKMKKRNYLFKNLPGENLKLKYFWTPKKNQEIMGIEIAEIKFKNSNR